MAESERPKPFRKEDFGLFLPRAGHGLREDRPKACFKDCHALTKFDIGEKVTEIGNQAFMGCKKPGTLSGCEGLAHIRNQAFQNNVKLASISQMPLPESIGEGAFRGCTSLTGFTCLSNVQTIGKDAFRNCTSFKIHFPPPGC